MPLLADLLSTPTGMAPAVATRFVVHEGHQTILDSRNPLKRAQLGIVDRSEDPLLNRVGLLQVAAAVEAALGVDLGG